MDIILHHSCTNLVLRSAWVWLDLRPPGLFCDKLAEPPISEEESHTLECVICVICVICINTILGWFFFIEYNIKTY